MFPWKTSRSLSWLRSAGVPTAAAARKKDDLPRRTARRGPAAVRMAPGSTAAGCRRAGERLAPVPRRRRGRAGDRGAPRFRYSRRPVRRVRTDGGSIRVRPETEIPQTQPARPLPGFRRSGRAARRSAAGGSAPQRRAVGKAPAPSGGGFPVSGGRQRKRGRNDRDKLKNQCRPSGNTRESAFSQEELW